MMGSINAGGEWTALNILLIMSDEHSYQAMGCSGHPVVGTPNLDRLAGQGVQFTNCYTNSPLCVPSRASFFTGRYVHELGAWDNSTAYDGRVPGISHHLARHDLVLSSFGKWDFHPEGTYEGLDARIFGVRKKPDLEALFREAGRARPHAEERFHDMGVRETPSHDEQVSEAALRWLAERRRGEKPWVLYLGFTQPHFPFRVKKEHWERYRGALKELPPAAREPFSSLNEPLLALRRYFQGDAAGDEIAIRAHEGYYASIAELDENVGSILSALDERGLTEDTLIVYTSDHGEQLGHHGLWWKCCMFEESAHVPLILKGPGIQDGARIQAPVSLVDIFPTLCQALDLPSPPHLAGRSLWNLAAGQADLPRQDFVFSEYHAHGMPVGMYMIRWRAWKYVYYVGYPPQLFNLDDDPGETRDLGEASSSAAGRAGGMVRGALAECEARLRSICDPEAVDRRAKAFQAGLRNRFGLGEAGRGEAWQGRVFPVAHPEEIHF